MKISYKNVDKKLFSEFIDNMLISELQSLYFNKEGLKIIGVQKTKNYISYQKFDHSENNFSEEVDAMFIVINKQKVVKNIGFSKSETINVEFEVKENIATKMKISSNFGNSSYISGNSINAIIMNEEQITPIFKPDNVICSYNVINEKFFKTVKDFFLNNKGELDHPSFIVNIDKESSIIKFCSLKDDRWEIEINDVVAENIIINESMTLTLTKEFFDNLKSTNCEFIFCNHGTIQKLIVIYSEGSKFVSTLMKK
jgi:hypothetical protein